MDPPRPPPPPRPTNATHEDGEAKLQGAVRQLIESEVVAERSQQHEDSLRGPPKPQRSVAVPPTQTPVLISGNRALRILSIDGGGLRGVLPLRVLQTIEHDANIGRPPELRRLQVCMISLPVVNYRRLRTFLTIFAEQAQVESLRSF